MWGIGKRRYRKNWRKRVDKVIRQVGVDSCGLWDGDIGDVVGEKGRDGKIREVFKVGLKDG